MVQRAAPSRPFASAPNRAGPTRLFASVRRSPPTSTQERPPRRAANEPGPQEGASLNGAAAHHAAIAIDEPPRGGDGARRYLYSIDLLALRAAGAEGDGECAGGARAAAAAAEAGRGDAICDDWIKDDEWWSDEEDEEKSDEETAGAKTSDATFPAKADSVLKELPKPIDNPDPAIQKQFQELEMIDPETATERGGRTPLVRRASIVVVRDMILEQVHVEKRLREVGRPQRQLKLQSLFH